MKRSLSPFVTASFLWAGYSEELEETFLESEYASGDEESIMASRLNDNDNLELYT
ncbi:hypothetical protein ACX0HA_14540 [Flavobacterium hauense]